MTEQRKACLTCKHVRFKIPADWKPTFEGEEYDRYDARRLIRETERHIAATCTFHPAWLEVTTGHYCGQWENAVRTEHESLREFLWGTWASREAKYLTETNAKLRARLKAVSRISASRLARLRGKANGKTQTEHPL